MGMNIYQFFFVVAALGGFSLSFALLFCSRLDPYSAMQQTQNTSCCYLHHYNAILKTDVIMEHYAIYGPQSSKLCGFFMAILLELQLDERGRELLFHRAVLKRFLFAQRTHHDRIITIVNNNRERAL
jgi:hypothetical protein